MARYLNIETEVIPFYLTVRGEVPKLLRNSHLLYEYYGVGSESRRQTGRLADVLNAIEENMRNFDECCDGTLTEETQLILRLCDAISTGYAGPITPDSSGYTYVRRLDASIATIRDAVKEVRTLARLRVCEYCDQLERECECERCEYCERHINDCECATCEYCDQNEHACSCERCYYCGSILQDCDCERCERCEQRISDCRCDHDDTKIIVNVGLPF